MADVDEKTVQLVKNELDDIKALITDKIVMERIRKDGSLLYLKFTVNAPTYYITGKNDTNPKSTNSIVFYIDVPYGYPKAGPTVYYESGKMLASVNAFTSGRQCIDDWHYDEESAANNSSLVGTVRKTVMDIIHDAVVSNYESVANGSVKEWQQRMTASHKFPTCRLNTLFHSEAYNAEHSGPPGLPQKPGACSRPAGTVGRSVMPPLPNR